MNGKVYNWQARGKYTLFGQLKWTPVTLAGYVASIVVNIWSKADTFPIPAG
ncbi:MAG: hypothetical protein OEY45_11435 [Gammaproteobacteria bacterium]|nr:hypothetical protein [Gammaproteobacteria bacterium]